MATTLNFTQKTSGWESAAITCAATSMAVHMEFAKSKGNKIIVLRSTDGTTYSPGYELPYNEPVFDQTLVGCVSGLKLKILTTNQPSNASYL